MEYHRSQDSLRHAKRREAMDRIRCQVRKHVIREAWEASCKFGRKTNYSGLGIDYTFETLLEHLYARKMCNDGKWLVGGCGKSHCVLCHYEKFFQIPSAQQRRQNQRAQEELEQFL